MESPVRQSPHRPSGVHDTGVPLTAHACLVADHSPCSQTVTWPMPLSPFSQSLRVSFVHSPHVPSDLQDALFSQVVCSHLPFTHFETLPSLQSALISPSVHSPQIPSAVQDALFSQTASSHLPDTHLVYLPSLQSALT